MPKKKKQSLPNQDVPLEEGIVIRSVGSRIRVKHTDGRLFECVVRGKFRIKGLNSTNPVAVGDKVRFHIPDKGELGTIKEILERKNYILRKAIGQNRKVHILAANLDQAIFLFTLDQPITSTGFANRFLLITEAYDIPTIFVINKIDLLKSPEQQRRLEEIKDIYGRIGYPVVCLSALDAQYHETAREMLQGKTSFIGGHSGAGKSTLINLVDPDLDIKTAQVSDYSNKGKHTTTYAEMHPLQSGGYIIDSPGIKEFGLAQFKKEEIPHFFPEFRERMADCRFHNCSHINEPKCAIKAALEEGEIHPSRYDTYLRMLDEVNTEKMY